MGPERQRAKPRAVEPQLPRAPRVQRVGELAFRAARPHAARISAEALIDALLSVPHVREVVLTEHFVVAHADAGSARVPTRRSLERALAALLGSTDAATRADGTPRAPRVHTVSVRYDGEDLDEVCHQAGLTRNALIALHTRGVYEVRFVGFSPGFAYLGPVDTRLHLPRRATPRPRVPPGSVAVAGGYTAVYPRASAGGWHLLGTALDFEPFDPRVGSLLRPGDRVCFVVA